MKYVKDVEKNTRMQNEFTNETRELFRWNYECFICGKNNQDALHHILGRENNSPLNVCPIHNFSCHLENSGQLNTDKIKGKLLRKVRQFLVDNNYQLTEDDLRFIEKYDRLYNTY